MTESIIYEMGAMARMAQDDETIFEALCLIEALRRIGVEDTTIADKDRDFSVLDYRRVIRVLPMVGKVRAGTQALLADKTQADDPCLFVRVQTEVLGQTWMGCVGPVKYDAIVAGEDGQTDFDRRFSAAVALWQKAPLQEIEPLWQRSKARGILDMLHQKLRQKGIAA